MMRAALLRALPGLVAFAAFVVVGVQVDLYTSGLLAQAFVFAIAAISLDLVWGYCGVLDLGHAVWFGIGVLSVALFRVHLGQYSIVLLYTDHVGLRYLAGAVVGLAAAAVVAAILGKFSFDRRSANHFLPAIITLGVSSAASIVYVQVKQAGGEGGLYGFGATWTDAHGWYWICGIAMALVLAVAYVFVRSDFGVLVRAVRDNAVRARYLGFDVERVQLAVFVLSATLAASAGVLYGFMIGIVSSSSFGFLLSTQMVIWVALGGRGTIIGPAVGAVALSLLSSKLNESFTNQWSLIEGLFFVVVVVLLPHGLLPLVARPLRWISGDRLSTHSVAARHYEIAEGPAVEEATPVLAQLDGVHFGYGALKVLRGLSLDFRAGEVLSIIGPNGAGKSTMVGVMTDGGSAIEGVVNYPFAGSGVWRGAPPHRLAQYGVVRKFQIPSLFPTLTVAETLLLASLRGRFPSVWRRTRAVPVSVAAARILEAGGLIDRAETVSSELAHGLKQTLEIAAAVNSGARLLIMDEPTAGVTEDERRSIGAALRELAEGGVGVVLIEHDIDFVQAVSHRVAILHNGVVVETGPPDTVAQSAVVREAYLGVTG
jgi:branched-chain amino acid transport system permease protein